LEETSKGWGTDATVKVGLTYNQKKEDASASGDTYVEWDDVETIEAIAQPLRTRHEVTLIEADKSAALRLKAESPDIVFNVAEGRLGPLREAEIPALLESLNIPYTGSSSETLSVTLDKAWTKRVLHRFGIPTPESMVCESMDYQLQGLTYPLIVKPLWEGSSKGIPNSSVVDNPRSLQKEVKRILEGYHQPALVERFLSGREFTAAVLGNGNALDVLPLVEVNFKSLPKEARPIYSYEAKWIWDTPESPLPIFECPAKIPYFLERKLVHLVKRTFQVLKCQDWCRIDLRLDERGEPYILEVNPLPGVLPDPRQNSCFPKAARARGLSYEALILKVFSIACKRWGLNETSNVREYSIRQ